MIKPTKNFVSVLMCAVLNVAVAGSEGAAAAAGGRPEQVVLQRSGWYDATAFSRGSDQSGV